MSFVNEIYHSFAYEMDADIAKQIFAHLIKFDISRLNGGMSTLELICGSAKAGYFDMFKSLYDNTYITRNLVNKLPMLIDYAAESGNIQLIAWMQDNGFKLTNNMMSIAINNHNPNLVKWLHENNCPYTNYILHEIAYNGDLNLLKWFYERNVTLHSMYEGAIKGGHLHILLWIIDAGCFYDMSVIAHFAIEHRHDNILKWLCENNYKFIIRNNIDQWKLLTKHGANIEFI